MEGGALSANENRNSHRRFASALVAAAAIGAGATLGLSQAFGSSSTTASGVTVPAAQPAALSSSTLLSPAQVYSRASGGVVDISVSGTGSSGFSPFGEQQTQGEGSGFVIDTKGDIVTNQHVVGGANSITVHFKDGTTAKAALVGADATTDIAVIRVNVSSSKLHPLTLGSSSGLQVGESVAAIGSPFGLPYSLTTGIVSATGRTITSPNDSSIAGAIQTDAAINHGNSGGPLIDAHGRVIGINAQIDSSSDGNNGVGFAIPIDTAKQVVSQLLSGGKVEHAFLGVEVGAAQSGGARITSVVSGSAAAKAGLKTGDVVLSVDGNRISTAAQLQSAIAAHKPGDAVTLRVSRSGSTLTLKATLGTRS
jgi:putative serine protease PepD